MIGMIFNSYNDCSLKNVKVRKSMLYLLINILLRLKSASQKPSCRGLVFKWYEASHQPASGDRRDAFQAGNIPAARVMLT
jgi:hypothetical protein